MCKSSYIGGLFLVWFIGYRIRCNYTPLKFHVCLALDSFKHGFLYGITWLMSVHLILGILKRAYKWKWITIPRYVFTVHLYTKTHMVINMISMIHLVSAQPWSQHVAAFDPLFLGWFQTSLGCMGCMVAGNYSPVLLVFIPISSWFHARFYCLRHVLLLKSQCFAGPFFKENSSPSLLVISALLFVNYKRFFVWIKRQNHAKPPFMMLKSWNPTTFIRSIYISSQVFSSSPSISVLKKLL